MLNQLLSPDAVNKQLIHRKEVNNADLYIFQQQDWPYFKWQEEKLLNLLAVVRHRQGKLFGVMQGLGFNLQAEATLQTLTLDVLKSSEIEGRHSFAMQAMLQQVTINAISSMLVYSSLKTTETYLKGLPNNVLDDYNSKIFGK